MSNSLKISIILPVFNSEKFLATAIKSVLNQTYENWELIIINDGSTDKSGLIAEEFKDKRIIIVTQENKGVSSARNQGLKKMKGDFYCFLDADDRLPERSLESRLEKYRSDPSLYFIDGKINVKDDLLLNNIRIWQPKATKNPLKELIRLSGNCFFNGSWLIKRTPETSVVFFNESISHGEDMLYLMELCKICNGNYGFTDSFILDYRLSSGSAMSNLKGLEQGYSKIQNIIFKWPEIKLRDKLIYYYRYKASMFLSYIRAKQYLNALSILLP